MTAVTATRTRRKPEPGDKASASVRIVDGLKVVAEEPVPSNLSRSSRTGDPVALRILRLRLEDGSERYACADCDFVAETRGSVQGHRSATHGSRRRSARRESLPADVAGMTIAEMLVIVESAVTFADRVEEMEETIASWRSRALDAETDLRHVRSTLERLVK